jgi:hypothetical protein
MGTVFIEFSGTSGSNKNPGTTIPGGAEFDPFLVVPPCWASTGGGVIVITRVRARNSARPDLQASQSEERIIFNLLLSRNWDVERQRQPDAGKFSVPMGEDTVYKPVYLYLNLLLAGGRPWGSALTSSRRVVLS